MLNCDELYLGNHVRESRGVGWVREGCKERVVSYAWRVDRSHIEDTHSECVQTKLNTTVRMV